eukprot:gnl/MRDRNA2_/MRDRNA2_27178_c0_seq1.p1 gnl/MRDRNA2_/MRDRNA2_27178_c0~~gnl/MRDRNA2_/MRDRNA2_27178_c0_seq1.p1  ORF type:complete len:151 (-),score=32.26 gnl/MRDRNA2_/MRDRNA2_27178_c0_seq1:323-775(-)
MCRDEALELNKIADDLKQAGAKRVVCLLKENLPEQVDEFRKDFWHQELYLDEGKAFYKALGGGEVVKQFSLTSFLATMANPFSKDPVKANINKTKQKGVIGNLTGEGFIHGGLFVMRKTGVAEFSFVERPMGAMASLDMVKEAVKAAAAA